MLPQLLDLDDIKSLTVKDVAHYQDKILITFTNGCFIQLKALYDYVSEDVGIYADESLRDEVYVDEDLIDLGILTKQELVRLEKERERARQRLLDAKDLREYLRLKEKFEPVVNFHING